MSSHTTPFELRIFVVNGDPDGLRIAQRSNSVGKALIFPRSLYPRIKSREEFAETGAYLLLGPSEDEDRELLYIGEGDPVRPRLDNHFAKKDFWNRAVLFVAGEGLLNKAHVQFLEAKLVQQAKNAKRLPLENGNEPAEPTLSEADRAIMEVFLKNMISMLPVLGIRAFEDAAHATPTGPKKSSRPEELILQGKGVRATGYETTQGFLVKSGSTAVSLVNEVPSLSAQVRWVYKARRDLVKSGILVSARSALRFSQDYTFSSPSLAAGVVLGCSANGRAAWKNSRGTTLKELQELASPISL